MNLLKKITTLPNLPSLLSAPFRILPAKQHSQLLTAFLNRILSQQIKEGDLDFLRHQHIRINVRDINIQYNISFDNGRLIPAPTDNHGDLIIQASLYDFLMLAARKEDPDTLVFQRRLIMQGNTELGLELKNLLDSLDMESSDSFVIIESFLQKSLPIYQKLFHQ